MNTSNRRSFIKGSSALAFASIISPTFQSHAAEQLDRFGGWKGKKFEATGFFRTEKDDRWWLVTPDGNAFLSFGINHLYPSVQTTLQQRCMAEAFGSG